MQSIAQRNIAIVCNPVAGNGRALQLAHEISKRLSGLFIPHQVFDEKWPADFSGFTEVFISGGDGTLNYFINQYRDIQIPLAIFKGGSGNDFQWLLYGKQSLEEQLKTALEADAKPVDAGICNGKLFINGIGMGFEGAVARSLAGKAKRQGKGSFLIAVLKKIFFYRSQLYTITSAEKQTTSRKLLVDIANGKRAGGGFYIAPLAEANDGKLDVVLLDRLSPWNRLKYLPAIEKGRHMGLRAVEYFTTKEISISSDHAIDYHLDGECYTDRSVEVKVLPGRFMFRY